MATQSVKLHANGEIRRFAIDLVDGNAKFENLVQKVARLYPELSIVKLAWKDSDNDMVAIMNDDDLTEAIRNIVDGVLQVHLISGEKHVKFADETVIDEVVAQEEILETKYAEATGPTNDAKEQDPTVHIGVNCDGCNGGVKGMRFKCLICPDYDLCETCESKHTHDEHPMIRIESPNDKSWMKGYFAAKFPFHPRRRHCRRSFHQDRLAPECGAHVTPCSQDPKRHEPNPDEAQEDFAFVPNVGEVISVALASLGIEPQLEEKADAQDPTVHIGVQCDGCNAIVKGLRYKCITCPNYDLCEPCQTNHVHDEHAMIRIVSPTDKSWHRGFYASQFPRHQRRVHCQKSFQHEPRHGGCAQRRCHHARNNDEAEQKSDSAKQDLIPISNVFETISAALLTSLDAIPEMNTVIEQQQRRRCQPSSHGRHGGQRGRSCGHRHGPPSCCKDTKFSASEQKPCSKEQNPEELLIPQLGEMISTMLAAIGLEPQQVSEPSIPVHSDGTPNTNVANEEKVFEKAFEQFLSMGFNK